VRDAVSIRAACKNGIFAISFSTETNKLLPHLTMAHVTLNGIEMVDCRLEL
jgi:hypothetical protein